MIYLDYAANTPPAREVLDCYYEEALKALANPNSVHSLGREAKGRMEEITEKIANLLQAKPSEIIYTSGASEANNLAIKGLAYKNKQVGKHIISTCLEHPSVSGTLSSLQAAGYEIDLVDITSEGLVDLDHLRELIRRDTIVVSICSVDSELGIRQPIAEIGELLREFPNCYFHTDATQAMGKLDISFQHVHCMSFAPHKFFGLNSTGILLKREDVELEPLIHGGGSTTIYRSGTPDLPMVAASLKALELSLTHREERYQFVEQLNKYLREKLQAFSRVRINSTKYSTPYILNISVQGVKATLFTKELEQESVCVSIKSACSVQNLPSRPVYAVTRDKKNAMCSWRISLSHLSTMEELEQFMKIFQKCYDMLV